jgi:preprotein translocase subunit SecD
MRAMIAMARICRKAGLLGLFVWLAVAGVSSSMAEPSLLEQLQKGGSSSPPPARKSLMPPLRLQVQKAEAAFDARTSEPIVVITMTARSGRMFSELTENNVGRRLVLRIDGQVVSEPLIREPIKGGVVQISGNMTAKDAAALAERLNKGEAKIEVELVSD